MNTIRKEIGIYTNRTQIVKKSGFVEHKRRRALNQVAQPGKGMTTNNQEITIKSMNDYLLWKTRPRILIEADRARKNVQSLGLGSESRRSIQRRSDVPEEASSRRSRGFCFCRYMSGPTFSTCLSSQQLS